MAEEIGALRAVLALESAAFDKGVASARRQLTGLEGGFQKTGGQVVQFGRRMSRDATAGFNSLSRSSRASRAGLQNFGYQVQDVAVQLQMGTSLSQTLGQQLPQLLSGFGLFGVALGTASALLIPLIGYLFKAGEATESWTDKLSLTSGSISGVRGAISALEGLQRQYNDAIAASGGASSAAASLVISNSTKEFEARKQLLAVEIQLLKIRGQEQASAMQNLKDTIKTAADEKMAAFDAVRVLQEKSRILDQVGLFDPTVINERAQVPEGVGPGIQGVGDVATAYGRVIKDRERDVLAIQKLNAELQITNLTISETEKLMDSTFETISSGPADVKKGRMSEAEREAARVFAETRTEAEKYAIEVDKLKKLLAAGGISQDTFNRAIDGLKEKFGEAAGAAKQLESSFQGAFASFVTGASSAQDAVASLLQDLAGMLANRAFRSLMGAGGSGIFASIVKVLGFADGPAVSGGRVQAFANGGIVSAPTIFPMANGAGLMGEAGPEAIMPLTRIGGKLGVRAAGGGGSVVNIDARYATEGTAEMIVKAIQRAAPGIVKQSVSANRAAGARGY